jgi:hypothetical protein
VRLHPTSVSFRRVFPPSPCVVPFLQGKLGALHDCFAPVIGRMCVQISRARCQFALPGVLEASLSRFRVLSTSLLDITQLKTRKIFTGRFHEGEDRGGWLRGFDCADEACIPCCAFFIRQNHQCHTAPCLGFLAQIPWWHNLVGQRAKQDRSANDAGWDEQELIDDDG